MRHRAPLAGAACWLAIATSWSTGVCAQPSLDMVGVHTGAIIRTGENSETLLGAAVRLRAGERLIVATALDVRTDIPDDPAGAWRATTWWWLTTVRTPLPRFGLVSVGAGAAVGRASAENTGRALELSTVTAREVVVVGVEASIRRLRPFADLHLVDVIRSPTEPSSHLTVGIGLSFR